MAAPFDPSSSFFFPFSPVPSTSDAPTAGALTPAPASTEPYTGTFAGKKLSCITCRKGKAKCIWPEGSAACELCLKRQLACPGPAAPQRKTKLSKEDQVAPVESPASSTGDGAVDWDAIAAFLSASQAGPSAPGSIHSLTSTAPFDPSASPPYTQPPSNQLTTTRRPTFSPYQTLAGRPRLLGPSSSEASINSVMRAKILKLELVDLYSKWWPLQSQGVMGWRTDAFEELLTGPKDEASRAFTAICLGLAARSSSHSEITQTPAPSLAFVDVTDQSSTLIPGGFGEWGIRRHGACIRLGKQAIEAATALATREPSLRSLKVLLGGLQLCSTLHEERGAYAPFTRLAINTYRTVLASPATTEQERSWLLGSFAPHLLSRDCKAALKYGRPLELSDAEVNLIFQVSGSKVGHLDCFGIPDWHPLGADLVVFDEGLIFAADYHSEVGLTYSLARIFNAHSLIPDSRTLIDGVRAVQALIDTFTGQVAERIAKLETLDPNRVFVLHEWTGKWRPDEPKVHAQIILSELVHDYSEMHLFINERLQVELAAGRLRTADLQTSLFLIETREKSRAGIRILAQGMQYFIQGKRSHATMANLYHHIIPVQGWVELTLARHGDPEGPLDKSAEVSTEEIGWLVKGLRVGSFAQATLVTPLRELEAGWEVLRREEVARSLESEPFDLSALLVDD